MFRVKKKIHDTAIFAAKLSCNTFRLGAVIFKGDKVISFGTNSSKSHPIVKEYSRDENKIYIHAEIHAILKAKDEVKDADLLVIRLNKNDELCMAKPCDVCKQLIIDSNIRNIVYSGEKGIFHHEHLL